MSCRRNQTLILNQISCSIKSEAIIAVMGASGSGKTTFLRAVAGLEKDLQGHIFWHKDDLDVCHTSIPFAQRRFGFVFQNSPLFSHLTVSENIDFGMRSKYTPYISKIERQRRITELLDLVGLKEYMSSYPSQLSGGQQQRIALARSLAPLPTVLFLDEPFSHLNQKLKETLMTPIFQWIKKRKMTVFWATHQDQDAFQYADQILLLKKGQMLTLGTPLQLYQNPFSKESAEFFGPILWIDPTHPLYTHPFFQTLNQKYTQSSIWGIRPHFWSLLFSKNSSVDESNPLSSESSEGASHSYLKLNGSLKSEVFRGNRNHLYIEVQLSTSSLLIHVERISNSSIELGHQLILQLTHPPLRLPVSLES